MVIKTKKLLYLLLCCALFVVLLPAAVSAAAGTDSYNYSQDGSNSNTMIAQSADAYGNPISGSSDSLTISATGGMYDGNAHPAFFNKTSFAGSALPSITYLKKDNGGTYSIAVTGEPVDAGEYRASFTLTGANGSKATAYTDYSISKCPLFIAGTTVADKLYDATRSAVITPGTLTGVLSGDDVTVDVHGSFSDCNVGTYSIEVEYTLSGDDSQNYAAPAENSLTAAILVRPVTLTSADALKVYDGTPLTCASVTIGGNGFADTQGVSFDVTGSQTVPGSTENFFDYTFNPDTDYRNYDIRTVTGTLTVTPAEPSAADFDFTAPSSLTEDGTSKAATVTARSGITGMGAITLLYYQGSTLLAGAPTAPGDYTVAVDVASGTCYSAKSNLTDASWTFTIQAAPQPPAPSCYTVTFHMNGCGSKPADQTVIAGARASRPSDPTSEGYTFEGWYIDASFSTEFDFDSAVTADTRLYAKWTQNSVSPIDPTEPVTPVTGDNSRIFLWITLAVLSLLGLGGSMAYNRKRKTDR